MSVNNSTEIDFLPAKCEFDNLAKSAAKIALGNFAWDHVTFVLFTNLLVCGVTTFIQLYGKSLIIGSHSLYPVVPENTSQFVVFALDMEDIRNILEWLKEYRINNTGKYVIVCQSYQKTACNEDEAVKLLWDNKVTNVIFIKILTNDTVAGYTYFFTDNCDNSSPFQMFTTNFSSVKNERYRTDMFPKKFSNLNLCPMIISTFVQKPYMYIRNNVPSGADGDFLTIIMKALNSTLVVMTPRRGAGWGHLDSNNTWVGSFGDIYYEWANASMTSSSITLSRFKTFQMSTHYYSVKVVWVTHPLNVEPASMKLLRPLKIKTRIALIMSFVVIFIFVSFVKRSCFHAVHAKVPLDQFPDGMLFRFWGMCMGQTVARVPKNKAILYFILFWVWYCFLVRTFYQVHLIDSLKNEFYTAGFKDIEEAIDEDYPFGGGSALKEYYINYPKIYENWINVESNNLYQTLDELSNGKKFLLAMNLATTQIYVKETKRQIFVLPKLIASSHSVIFFKKYSPVVESISRVMTQLFECGWPQKIYKNYTVHNYKFLPDNDNRPIALQHFTGCYVILIVGWIVSMCCFIVELCTAWERRS